MPVSLAEITASTEPSGLGVLHLKRYWHKAQLHKSGRLARDSLPEEGLYDTTLLAVLGVGLEQAVMQLYHSSGDFGEFENWILSVNGQALDQRKIDAFNHCVLSRGSAPQKPDPASFVLSAADLQFWEENGYIILRNAASREDCEAAIAAICEFIQIDRHDPATWYRPHPARQGIMVQLFQHPALEKNRQSPKVRAAYEQLWNRTDLWLNTDRAGFNPPETPQWTFPGPHMHWDMSLAQPIPFGLQGILYLADTEANQGAFTLVPGFQHRVGAWMKALPPGTNPRREDIHALGSRPVVANAGDFIIWHQALPHGSSPNTSSLPRFVQYINYVPLDAEVREEWI